MTGKNVIHCHSIVYNYMFYYTIQDKLTHNNLTLYSMH